MYGVFFSFRNKALDFWTNFPLCIHLFVLITPVLELGPFILHFASAMTETSPFGFGLFSSAKILPKWTKKNRFVFWLFSGLWFTRFGYYSNSTKVNRKNRLFFSYFCYLKTIITVIFWQLGRCVHFHVFATCDDDKNKKKWRRWFY